MGVESPPEFTPPARRRSAIKARRLTQQDASELMGIDQSKVSRITRGQFRGVSEAAHRKFKRCRSALYALWAALIAVLAMRHSHAKPAQGDRTTA